MDQIETHLALHCIQKELDHPMKEGRLPEVDDWAALRNFEEAWQALSHYSNQRSPSRCGTFS